MNEGKLYILEKLRQKLVETWPYFISYHHMIKEFEGETRTYLKGNRETVLMELTAYCYLIEESKENHRVRYAVDPERDANFERKIFFSNKEL